METKLFWKPVDGVGFKELDCVAEIKGLESIDDGFDKVQHQAHTHKGFTQTFDMKIENCNIRKLLYTRVPRKKKKWQKKQVAMIDGKSVKHLRYDYLGCYYWIK